MRNLSAIQNSFSEDSISSSKRPMALGLYWSCAGLEGKSLLKVLKISRLVAARL